MTTLAFDEPTAYVPRHRADSNAYTDHARAVLAGHLSAVAGELDHMLAAWANLNLPADVLTPAEYPFADTLEETAARVHRSVDRIRATFPADDPA